MSNTPESEFDLELHFLPAWATQPAKPNRYAQYEGGADRGGDHRKERRDRPPRRMQAQPARGPSIPGSAADGPIRAAPARSQDRGRERPGPPAPPLPEVNVAFVPDDAGVDS
jgi:hypothetical protein